MTPPDLQQIRAAVARDPRNAELRYLLGAELAQQKEYDAAVVEMSTALQLDPLYLTMAQPNQSLEIWAPLESLGETAALKFFKRGLEALIRDDFDTCVGMLRHGIELNTQNAPLNYDMTQVIDRVDEALVPVPQTITASPKTAPADFTRYGDAGKTRH